MSQANNAFKVYQASAGSGKTYTIVKEYLVLCLRDQASMADFRQILAITFTNLAANEMKRKIVLQLHDIIHSDNSQEPKGMEADLLEELHVDRNTLRSRAKTLFRNIIHDYSSFCVCTIDAFVQKLARSFAKDLGLPSQFSVSIDEDEVADAITERLGTQIGVDHPFLTKILEDFCELKFDNEKSPKVANNIHEFIKKLFSEETFQKHQQQIVTEEEYKETLAFLHQHTQGFESRCQQFIKDFEQFIQQNQLTEDDFNYKSKGPCLGLLKKLKDKEYKPLGDRQLKLLDGSMNWYSNTLPKRLATLMDSLQSEFQETILPFLQLYRDKFGAYLYYKSQLHQMSLYVLRSIIKSEMDAFIGEEQTVHITEFNKRINEVMGDFSVPFIYERLGEHFKHVFIDEFQDTSVLQWQNLIPLLDNNLSKGNMNMIVGDGKQSIYRWRNGEVGQIVSLPLIYGKPTDSPAFTDFEHTLINNFKFNELKNNYRSFTNVVDFNNRFFRFSADSPFLTEQSRKVYIDEDRRFMKEVSIEQVCKHKEEGYVQVELFDSKQNDVGTPLSRIKALIEELAGLGFSRCDIAILVRKNKIGSLIANYLNDNGIDVVSSESILLKYSEKVQLIINTLDYLIHADNKAVVATVLYYWHATHREGFDGVVDGIFDAVADIAEGRQAMEEALGLEPLALASLMARSYSLYDLCSALARLFGFNTVNDSYINFLLDVVYQWQSTDESGIEAFLEYWEKKKDKLSVVTGNGDAVSIMTIHKSKGLEFPVVIYPFMVDDLDDKKSGSLWTEPEKLGFEAIPNLSQVQFSLTKDSAEWTPQTKRLFEEEGAKTRLDNMNLNYVAFTRAVQRLHVLSYHSNNGSASPLNAFLKTCEAQRVETDEGSLLYAFGDPKTRKVERNESDKKLPEIMVESKSSEWFDKITIDPDPSMFWMSKEDQMKPQEWGEFVHQVLSEVRQAQDIDRALLPYLDSGVIDQATASRLRDRFLEMAEEPLIRDAFSPQAKIKAECEILSKAYGIIRPDRYAELPDRILLLDYKTGKKSHEHHRQILEYKSVLQGMVDKPIEAYLVYLDSKVDVVTPPSNGNSRDDSSRNRP